MNNPKESIATLIARQRQQRADAIEPFAEIVERVAKEIGVPIQETPRSSGFHRVWKLHSVLDGSASATTTFKLYHPYRGYSSHGDLRFQYRRLRTSNTKPRSCWVTTLSPDSIKKILLAGYENNQIALAERAQEANKE